MNIHLKPETEQLIRSDLERGPYQNAEEYLERAVNLLHEQEEWLVTDAAQIHAQIEEGYASAQGGELIDEDTVRSEMDNKKRAWLAVRRRA